MTMETLMERALAMPAACAENPFGPDCICIRIGPHGPIFANFAPDRNWVNLRCEAQMGWIWRTDFPGHVRRGYHCPSSQQPYNNTVILDGVVPDDVLCAMLEHSYGRALRSMTKARRTALFGSAQ